MPENEVFNEECRHCWWRGGDHCYLGPCEHDEPWISSKMAAGWCAGYIDQPAVLEHVFPSAKLQILSEGQVADEHGGFKVGRCVYNAAALERVDLREEPTEPILN